MLKLITDPRWANIAALISVIGAIATAALAVYGFAHGAGGHEERDRLLEKRIADLETRLQTVTASSGQGVEAECVRLTQRLQITESIAEEQRINSAMNGIGCSRVQ